MLGNGIKQTTATTGTGALTLAAVTDMPTLANVFALNQPFSYTLLDAAGLFIEAGIGYLSSSTVLVRAKVMATFVSSTYTNQGATAASLTGTTTVIGALHAGSVAFTPSSMDTVSSIGKFVSSGQRTLSATAGISAPNRCVYHPFYLPLPITLASLAINVTVLQTSAIIKTAVYSMAPNGYIGDRLAFAPDLDGATTGWKVGTIAAPVHLPAGWYYTAYCASGSATGPTVTVYNGATTSPLGGSPVGLASGGISSLEFRWETLGAGAALPATPSASTTQSIIGALPCPLIFLGAA